MMLQLPPKPPYRAKRDFFRQGVVTASGGGVFGNSRNTGEEGNREGDMAMGESGMEATVRHQGETLERLEKKIDNVEKNQRSDFRWYLAGIGALGLLVVGTPYFYFKNASQSLSFQQLTDAGYIITLPSSGSAKGVKKSD